MTKKHFLILCTDPLTHCKVDESKFNLHVVEDLSTFIDTANRLRPDAIYCSFDGANLLNRHFFESLSPEASDHLKVIANNGVGYNHIDVQAATEKGIYIANTPDAVTDSTADMALYLMLSISRKANAYEQAIRAGKSFGEARNSVGQGYSLRGKNLAIVGMGRIGRAVAERALSFGMRIFYVKRSRLPEEEEIALQVCGFAPTVGELLAAHEIDYLSVNCPLNAETRHLIGAKELALLPPGRSFVVNTARGAIIDEQALVDSLVSGHLRGAGLDVFENEPEIHPTLLKLDSTRAVIVPHIGTEVDETRREMQSLCMQNIESTLCSEKRHPVTPVPEQQGLQF